MRKILSVCGVLMLMSVQAQAACYSASEAEAEQGIRIHSELMVIGLNCQHMTPTGQKNYYAQYREFTSVHQDLIKDYEARLLKFYKRSGEANPEAALNDLRTGFANKISQHSAKMRPDVFCSKFIERIGKAGKMNRNQVRKWAATFYASHPVSRPICAN